MLLRRLRASVRLASRRLDVQAFVEIASALGVLACFLQLNAGRSQGRRLETEVTMAQDKPFHLTGNFAPVQDEVSAEHLEVEGAIPSGLRGLYLRNLSLIHI